MEVLGGFDDWRRKGGGEGKGGAMGPEDGGAGFQISEFPVRNICAPRGWREEFRSGFSIF